MYYIICKNNRGKMHIALSGQTFKTLPEARAACALIAYHRVPKVVRIVSTPVKRK